MRRAQTDAERKLWNALRNRTLGGHRFKRQVPVGPYVADFVCVEAGLIVELDGDQHAFQEEYDHHRTAFLNERGYRVLRFTNRDVLTNLEGVAATILHAAASLARETGEGGARAEGVGG